MIKLFYLKNFYEFNLSNIITDNNNTLIVRSEHKEYIDINLDSYNNIGWDEFKYNYLNYDNYNNIVIIGISRMINPANRCNFINDYLSIMTRNKNKIIIDNRPFLGEPWRLFWNFQFANLDYLFGANYSYPIEGNYEKWFLKESNTSIFMKDILFNIIKGTFYTNLVKLNTNFTFIDIDKKDEEYYNEIKNIIKEKYFTPKLIINNLLKICNKHFNIDINFDSYLTNKNYILPNLKIYKFIVEENIRRMDVYNLFTIG